MSQPLTMLTVLTQMPAFISVIGVNACSDLPCLALYPEECLRPPQPTGAGPGSSSPTFPKCCVVTSRQFSVERLLRLLMALGQDGRDQAAPG